MAFRTGDAMPPLTGATEWINSSVGPQDLVGYPVLIQFWAISCPVCKMNIPALQHWQEVYGPQGLRLVSVHMPRCEADTDVEAIKRAVEEYDITGPCAVDNQHSIGESFQTGGMWPYYFLFDRQGKMRLRAAGPVGLRLAENALKRMLDQESEAVAP